ncbi:MAG: PH domain-containing protein [Bacteriovoracaceae bacterium]|nr:PH domain-containing protein [Bacteriovoracaceae bacterium]
MKFEYLDAKSTFMKNVIEKDVEYVKGMLSDNEELVGLTVGVLQQDYGLYALTENRLLFCSTANGRNIIREYPLASVKSVHLAQTGLYNIRLTCENSFYRLGIGWQAAREFCKLLDQALESHSEAA